MAMIRDRVMAGRQVHGAMVFKFFSAGIAQILAHAGRAYVLYGIEHTGTGRETVKDKVSHCRSLATTPMARRLPLLGALDIDPRA